MATPILIDLSNYDSLLVQSTAGRAGTPDGNVFFDSANKKVEFITATEVASIDLSGGITTGAITVDAAAAGTFIRSAGNFITDGFVAGRQFAASGYIAGGNNTTFTILSITQTTNPGDTITVTDNTGMVTETGDADETIASVSEPNPLTAQLGIKLEAAYAFENQERRTDENLRKYDKMIKGNFKFAGAYIFEKSNKPSTTADRAIIRGSGWTEFATDGGTDRIYYGNQGLSNIESGSQPYNQLSSLATPDVNTLVPADYAKAGQISEAVQTFGSTANTPSDAGAGDFDTRAYESVSIRTYGQNYDRKETTTDLGIAELGGYLTGFAVNESVHLTTGDYPLASVSPDSTIDLATQTIDFTATEVVLNNAAASDNDWTSLGFGVGSQLIISGSTTPANDTTYTIVSISTTTDTNDTVVTSVAPDTIEVGTGAQTLDNVQIAPWTSMTLEKLAVAQTETGFNEADGDFTWVLNNTADGTLAQCVSFLDYSSQVDLDIDSGSETITYGKRVSTWYSYNATGQVVTNSGADTLGLFIEQIPVADEQSVVFTDDAGDLKTRPFSVSVEGEVGATAKADSLAWYHNYFAALYNTSGALTVEDSASALVKGLASTADGDNKIIYAFDYDGDTIGGTAGTDKDCVFLVEGDGGATQAKTLFTVTRITTVAFACIPAVENNV